MIVMLIDYYDFKRRFFCKRFCKVHSCKPATYNYNLHNGFFN